jgi:hypothetical protein
MGWSGLVNGALLGVAVSAGFEVLLTCDRNTQHQQNLSSVGLAFVVVAVPDTKLQTIRPLVPDILAVLDSDPQPGTLPVVGSWRV